MISTQNKRLSEEAWRKDAKQAKADGIEAINCLRGYLLQLQAQFEAHSGDDALVRSLQRLSEVNFQVQLNAQKINLAVQRCTDQIPQRFKK